MPRERPGGIDDRIRIQHMIDAGRQVAQFISGRTRASLDGEAYSPVRTSKYFW